MFEYANRESGVFTYRCMTILNTDDLDLRQKPSWMLVKIICSFPFPFPIPSICKSKLKASF